MIGCGSTGIYFPPLMICLLFSAHRAQGEAEQEREVSEVTYPADEEGDNLNSYGRKKKKGIYSSARLVF